MPEIWIPEKDQKIIEIKYWRSIWARHRENCSRNQIKLVNGCVKEELIEVAKNVLGNWCVYDLYKCPECGARIELNY